MKRYIINIIVVLDVLLNALSCGSPYETISARCARGHQRLTHLINRLFQDPTHCGRALSVTGSPALSVPVAERWQIYAAWALIATIYLLS